MGHDVVGWPVSKITGAVHCSRERRPTHEGSGMSAVDVVLQVFRAVEERNPQLAVVNIHVPAAGLAGIRIAELGYPGVEGTETAQLRCATPVSGFHASAVSWRGCPR